MPDKVPSYTLDVRGLRAWGAATGNQFASVQADIQNGSIIVYGVAYNEYCKVYDDDCHAVKSAKIKRSQLSDEHRESIIAIAESAQETLGFKGPYDKAVEWQIAGAACCDDLIIVTDERGKQRYSKIDGVQAMTFDEFIQRDDE